jgi:hypothetical protein
MSVAVVEGHVDQRRHRHPTGRGGSGQDAPGPGGEVPVDHLALDLEADEQKEHRHQGVVDPVQQAERPEIGSERGEIRLGERRVRGEDRGRGGDHQHDAGRGLAVEKLAENRPDAPLRRVARVVEIGHGQGSRGVVSGSVSVGNVRSADARSTRPGHAR